MVIFALAWIGLMLIAVKKPRLVNKIGQPSVADT
jgi:hypothetical protein